MAVLAGAAGVSGQSGIISARSFGTAGVSGRGSVSFGGRGGQFQSDSCRHGPESHGVRPKLTTS